jgi:Asp-tRNA(Asn)/Glu-tRNA(Gln) amidotransferase A subunit family amidase
MIEISTRNICMAFSFGIETDGSIMFPADRNAVVGIKPTVGLTSTSGVIPESPSMDTAGPFGRSSGCDDSFGYYSGDKYGLRLR